MKKNFSEQVKDYPLNHLVKLKTEQPARNRNHSLDNSTSKLQ